MDKEVRLSLAYQCRQACSKHRLQGVRFAPPSLEWQDLQAQVLDAMTLMWVLKASQPRSAKILAQELLTVGPECYNTAEDTLHSHQQLEQATRSSLTAACVLQAWQPISENAKILVRELLMIAVSTATQHAAQLLAATTYQQAPAA